MDPFVVDLCFPFSFVIGLFAAVSESLDIRPAVLHTNKFYSNILVSVRIAALVLLTVLWTFTAVHAWFTLGSPVWHSFLKSLDSSLALLWLLKASRKFVARTRRLAALSETGLVQFIEDARSSPPL